MTDQPNCVPEEAVRQRSIDFIRKKWGSLADLPKHVIPVVWVTTYRSFEITMKVEAEGGPRGLMKNMLVGDRQLTRQLNEASTKIEFLVKMISLLRSTPSQRQKAIDGYVLVDFLKWAIDRNIELEDMSGLRRMVMRQFAKADPEYKKPIPPEIT
jgi:hypothetical protein